MESIVEFILQIIAVLGAVGLTALISLAAWRIFKYKLPEDKETTIRKWIQAFILQAEEKYLKKEIVDQFNWVWNKAQDKFPWLGFVETSDLIHQEIPKLAPLGIGAAGKAYLKKIQLPSGLTGPGSGAGSITPETGGVPEPAAAGTGG